MLLGTTEVKTVFNFPFTYLVPTILLQYFQRVAAVKWFTDSQFPFEIKKKKIL